MPGPRSQLSTSFRFGRIVWPVLFYLFLAAPVQAQRIEISWPTPNPAWAEGKSYEAWVQPTVSGEPESGLFGCIRSGGAQFHEGLDIRPIARDSHGEPTDRITAAMDGVVRLVNTSPGNSNYGRYIVLEHPGVSPAVYTLYAHLARAEPGIFPGVEVKRGQVIATMGHSSSTGIPRDRAHLHFEIGLMMSQDFPAWYAWKKFGSANEHGLYNGMNLMGIDPQDFLRDWRTGKVDNFQQYFDAMRPVVTFRIATSRVPDFITRYPALLRKPLPSVPVAGWEVECNSTGLPFAWTPLTAMEIFGLGSNTVKITKAEAPLVRAFRCKALVKMRGGDYVPGSDLTEMLQQVFGVR